MKQDINRSRGHYVHRISYTARERLVGVFVMVATVIVIMLITVNPQTVGMFEERVTYNAKFQDARGITRDTVVRVSGLDVGKVSGFDIEDDNSIHVKMAVRKKFQRLIRSGSTARLNRLILLGNVAIDIDAGSPDQPVLDEGSELPVEETLSVDELVAGLAALVRPKDAPSTADLLAALTSAAENLRAITAHVKSGEGALGAAIYDEQLHQALGNSMNSVERTLDQFSARLADMEPAIGAATKAIGTLAATTENIPQMTSQLSHAILQINEALTILNQELREFPDVMLRMNILMDDAERVLDGMRRVWPLSSTIPQPPGNNVIKTQPIHD